MQNTRTISLSCPTLFSYSFISLTLQIFTIMHWKTKAQRKAVDLWMKLLRNDRMLFCSTEVCGFKSFVLPSLSVQQMKDGKKSGQRKCPGVKGTDGAWLVC